MIDLFKMRTMIFHDFPLCYVTFPKGNSEISEEIEKKKTDLNRSKQDLPNKFTRCWSKDLATGVAAELRPAMAI